MNVDEMLDSLNPQELAALESEIDKISCDTAERYYFQLGAKMARESVGELKKTGKLTPALFIAKEAITPPNGRVREAFTAAAKGKGSWKQVKQVAREQVGKAADAEIARVIDKCSAEELAAVEKAIDAEAATEKTAVEYAETYFGFGRKMAADVFGQLKKEGAARGPASFIASLSKTLGAKTPAKTWMEFPGKHPLITAGAGLYAGTKLLERQ